MSGGDAGLDNLVGLMGGSGDALLEDPLPGPMELLQQQRLERARGLQRDEAASTYARRRLQELGRGPNEGDATMVQELRLLEAERRGLLRDEIRTQLWNRDLVGRLSQSPPRTTSKYYSALHPSLPDAASPQGGGGAAGRIAAGSGMAMGSETPIHAYGCVRGSPSQQCVSPQARSGASVIPSGGARGLQQQQPRGPAGREAAVLQLAEFLASMPEGVALSAEEVAAAYDLSGRMRSGRRSRGSPV